MRRAASLVKRAPCVPLQVEQQHAVHVPAACAAAVCSVCSLLQLLCTGSRACCLSVVAACLRVWCRWCPELGLQQAIIMHYAELLAGHDAWW